MSDMGCEKSKYTVVDDNLAKLVKISRVGVRVRVRVTVRVGV